MEKVFCEPKYFNLLGVHLKDSWSGFSYISNPTANLEHILPKSKSCTYNLASENLKLSSF